MVHQMAHTELDSALMSALYEEQIDLLGSGKMAVYIVKNGRIPSATTSRYRRSSSSIG